MRFPLFFLWFGGLIGGALTPCSRAAESPALVSLSAFVREPDWDADADGLVDLAEDCMEAEGPAATRDALLALHDAEGKLAARLKICQVLAWAAGAGGVRKDLSDLFLARREASPRSAAAWLDYAVSGDRTERQTWSGALKKAAEFGAGDGAVMREVVERFIVGRECGNALAAALRWEQHLPSGEAKCQVAALSLCAGDPAVGWKAIGEAVLLPDLRSEDLLRFALTAGEMQEWRRLEKVLEKGRLRFPGDPRLTAMQALVLEECGEDVRAAELFLEMAAHPGTWPPARREARIRNWMEQREEMDYDHLPPGTRDVMRLEMWQEKAYRHRQQKFGYSPSDLDSPPEPVIQLPVDGDEARAFAMVHLRTLAMTSRAVTNEAVDALLQKCGAAHLIVPFPLNEQGAESDRLRKALRENDAYLAWRLAENSVWRRSSKWEPEWLKGMVERFEERYPRLAFNAARQLAGQNGDEARRWAEPALKAYRRCVRETPVWAREAAIELVGARAEWLEWPNAMDWQETVLSVLADAVRMAPPSTGGRADAMGVFRSRQEFVLPFFLGLQQAGKWKELAAAFEAEAGRRETLENCGDFLPFKVSGGGGTLLTEDALCFPNLLFRWPSVVVSTLGAGDSVQTGRNEFPLKAGPWVRELKDPWLKLMAEWRFGDKAAVERDIENRLAGPAATLEDCWIGAWLAWDGTGDFESEALDQAGIRLAAVRLARAVEFPVRDAVRVHVDAALLRSVLALGERPAELLAAARGAMRRLCEGRFTDVSSGQSLQRACEELGFHEEVASTEKIVIQPSPRTSRWMRPDFAMERWIGRLELGRGSPPSDRPGPSLAEGMQSLHRIRPGKGGIRGYLDSLKRWRDAGLFGEMAAAATPSANATDREWQRAGFEFEMLERPALAREYYQQALTRNPELHQARAWLIALDLDGRADEARALFEAAPPRAIEAAIEALCSAITFYGHDNTPVPSVTESIGILTGWVEALAARGEALPEQVRPRLEMLIYNRKSQELYPLRQALLTFPGIGLTAFRGIATDAMQRRIPLSESAAAARRWLQARSQWSVDQRKLGTSIGGLQEVSAVKGLVSEPQPCLMLVWEAWERNAGAEVSGRIIPLMREAGMDQASSILTGADLFFEPPDQFIAAARRFLADADACGLFVSPVFGRYYATEFVVMVWHLRKLEITLDPIFSGMAEPVTARSALQNDWTSRNLQNTWISYQTIRRDPRAETIADHARSVRSKLLGDDPPRRQRVLLEIQEAQGGARALGWRRGHAIPPAASQYGSWITALISEPATCRVALDMVGEDGGSMHSGWILNSIKQSFWSAGEKGPEQLLAMLDAWELLAPAPRFRPWSTAADPEGLVDDAANVLTNGKNALAARKLLKSRKPITFGAALILNYTGSSGNEAGITQLVKEHRDGIALIPEEQWPQVGWFFRYAGRWDQPWTLTKEAREGLAPLIEQERKRLITFAGLILKSDSWDTVASGLSGQDFLERSAQSVLFLLDSLDKITAGLVADKVLSNLVKARATSSPQLSPLPSESLPNWIFYAAQTLESCDLIDEAFARSTDIARLPESEQAELKEVRENIKRNLINAAAGKSGDGQGGGVREK